MRIRGGTTAEVNRAQNKSTVLKKKRALIQQSVIVLKIVLNLNSKWGMQIHVGALCTSSTLHAATLLAVMPATVGRSLLC